MNRSRIFLVVSLSLLGFSGISCSTVDSKRDYQPGYSSAGTQQQDTSSWQDRTFRPGGY